MSLIIDSSYASLKEAIRGTKAPPEVRNALELLTVRYYSFDEQLHQGQIVIHKDLARDVTEVFQELLRARFPVAKAIPIVHYDWDDDASMADNNTSAFNYRVIMGTNRLSYHATGTALDINPVQNPFCKRGVDDPAMQLHDVTARGTLFEASLPVVLFKQRGWKWGGNWTLPKDFQHLEKPQ